MQLIVLLVLVGSSFVLSAKPCCPKNQILRHAHLYSCGIRKDKLINMDACDAKTHTLRDVVLENDDVSSLRLHLVHADNPKRYCVGRMYRNIDKKSQGTVPVAVICIKKIMADAVKRIHVPTVPSTTPEEQAQQQQADDDSEDYDDEEEEESEEEDSDES